MRSPRLPVLAVLALTASCASSGPAPRAVAAPARAGAVVDTGRIDGAPYRIEIPEGWRGGLVMYAHGYEVRTPEGPAVPTGASRTRDAFLSRGFAYAQSAYRAQGWAVAEAIEDTEALRRHFIARYGRPDSTFVTGHSMGGYITLATLERYPGHYHGGLPLCGPLSPAQDFFSEGMFDLLVAFDHLFPGALPDASQGLADPGAPPTVDARAIAAALEAEPARAAGLAQRFGIRPPDLPGVVSFYYTVLKELQHRAGGNPFDNTEVVYSGYGDDVALNRGIRRYAAAPGAAEYLRGIYAPTGRVSAPVLSVHTTYDPIVPAPYANRYAQIAGRAGTRDRFVGRYVAADGHCAMGAAQVGAAFDALRTWANTGARPAGGEIP
jgi:pimeloyl-ACP methyl ester carboxylesterase